MADKVDRAIEVDSCSCSTSWTIFLGKRIKARSNESSGGVCETRGRSGVER